mmetsp:Transcript_950/g.2818  ORF Transcript_950/g.2818 Transcript_950/m.2818 type:complete len:187 (-) Transcript_950:153-713(-)|eukprot:CAMPEP_0197388462 /NCGR_PEP_ID=MMETSP1165-20131217/1094_1 /TAXON_ID=284809 /ORGANISM="Chrysocystis fragilis, Strain CCMP3189" /LENGTH=186 /DNA_ID=CAMNT_0042913809 /DNA_START=6 /DNA_END=566 /DNA_ORIENTATION=+
MWSVFVVSVALRAGVQALVPATSRVAPSAQEGAAACCNRREAVAIAGSLVAGLVALPALAEEAAAPAEAPPVAVEFPTDWGLTQDYYTDAAKVVSHMKLATSLDKGAPNMEKIALNTKKEMSDFVAFYRRFTNVSGKQSFSTLYTSINVLAGHYTSYGPKFPVPEKRRKRLYQEYAEIEKNIKKRR